MPLIADVGFGNNRTEPINGKGSPDYNRKGKDTNKREQLRYHRVFKFNGG